MIKMLFLWLPHPPKSWKSSDFQSCSSTSQGANCSISIYLSSTPGSFILASVVHSPPDTSGEKACSNM